MTENINQPNQNKPKVVGVKLSGRIRRWFIDNSTKPIAEKLLYFISFVDSFLSPLPPDPFLALLSVLNPKKWVRYAFWTTGYGLIGGIVGYIIGFALFEYVGEIFMNLYNFTGELQNLGQTFVDNAFLAIFIAAFTPIPYQIFTVAGGLFRINFFVFVAASILGRGLRFFIVSWVMYHVGENFGKIILKYLNWVLLFFGLALFVYIIFF